MLIADEKRASSSKDPFSFKVGHRAKRYSPGSQTHTSYNIVSKEVILRLANNDCGGRGVLQY